MKKGKTGLYKFLGGIISHLITTMTSSDSISSIQDIYDQLQSNSDTIPLNFVSLRRSEAIVFLYIPEIDNISMSPSSQCALRVNANLSVEMYVGKLKLSKTFFDRVLQKSETVASFTELCNLLAIAKTLFKTIFLL